MKKEQDKEVDMKRQLVIMVMVFVMMLFVQTAFAESIDGSVVMANNSRPVMNAEVMLKNPAGVKIVSVFSDKDGKFSLENVPSGTYMITVYSPNGKSSVTKKNIQVSDGHFTVVDFEVGPVKSRWGMNMNTQFADAS